LAVDAAVPIVPIRIRFKKRKRGILRFLLGHSILMKIGQPQYPDPQLLEREATRDLMERTRLEMERL
jgi:hypothetical protein